MGRAIPDPRPAGGPLPKGNHGRKPPMPKSKSNGRRPSPPPVSTKSHGKKPPPPTNNADKCCPMVEAARSVRRGKFRLARRYAAWSVRLIAARVIA